MSYMKKLYLECETGISGDMIVASLLDLGADETVLRNVLSGVKDQGFEIKISRVMKSGIDCCDFDVQLDAEHENHDHDMEYLYGASGEEHHHQKNITIMKIMWDIITIMMLEIWKIFIR